MVVILYRLWCCHGQTRPSWSQLQPFGQTQPKLSWQGRLAGQRIHPQQMRPYQSTITVDASRFTMQALRVTAPASCTITAKDSFSGLIQVVLYHGYVGVMAGHSTHDGYHQTTEHVTIEGPCVAVETPDGKYPRGIHAFLYFASVRQPTGSALLRGVDALFMPTSYNMSVDGLTGVNGLSGGRAEWKLPAGTLLNGMFNGLTVVPMVRKAP